MYAITGGSWATVVPPLQVWHMMLRHKQGRGMNSAACGVPRHASTTVTEEPGVGGVDQVMT